MPRGFANLGLPAILALLLGLGLGSFTPAAADEIDSARGQLRQAYSAELAELAGWCRERGLASQAARTESWLLPDRRRMLTVYLLPSGPLQTLATLDDPPDVQEWGKRFTALRNQQADALWQLARRAVRDGQLSQAMLLVNQAGRENPDHPEVRRLLGFEQYNQGWYTPFEIQQLRSGHLWHEKFGWLPEDHVQRYEEGQRYHRRTWMTAERETELRSNINSGWKIRTQHYQITTNAGMEAGVALGVRLERLQTAWRTLFAGYLAPKSKLTRLFSTGSLVTGARRPHNVMYFRNREEFQQALKREIPQGLNTTGLYMSNLETAYFYAQEDADRSDDNTLFHEATHQLFSESSPGLRNLVGQQQNFWIVEGVACYMESLTEREDHLTLGGIDAYRVQDARYYLWKKDFYLPMTDLCRLGMSDLQRSESIGAVYAQSAAVTDMLMHAEGGRHRDALVRFLSAVYAGRDRVGSLASETGVSLTKLDKEYRSYAQLKDQDLASIARPASLTYLTLGGSEVTDDGLQQLGEFPALRWIDLYKTGVTNDGLSILKNYPTLQQLDLSATAVTDEGLKNLRPLTQMDQLILGATRVTGAGLEHLVPIQRLTRLQLWNTHVGDAGLESLAKLPALMELDLAGSNVTDAAVPALARLRGLKQLDLSRTKITPPAAAQLQQALPQAEVKREE